MSLTDMIVKPHEFVDGGVTIWTVRRGSRFFVVRRGKRGNWETSDITDTVLDVSDDLSGSLEYIEGLFR